MIVPVCPSYHGYRILDIKEDPGYIEVVGTGGADTAYNKECVIVAVTMEDIAKAVGNRESLDAQIRQLEEERDAAIRNVAVLDNARALFNEDDTRDEDSFRAELLELSEESQFPDRKLKDWAKSIDPALSFRGWGIDNERNELFPDFSLEVPKEITDELVRNVNFFARIVSPVQSARLRIVNESFMMGYEGTYMKFDGAKLENAFTVCGTSRSGTSATAPLLATLRSVSERAFSSWNSYND